MKPSYPIAYRDEIVETQGKLFGRYQREHPDADGVDFMSAYMRGETRARIDDAAAVLANMTASELQDVFLDREGYVIRPGRPTDPLAADWIGRFYAYYQWQTGEKSKDIIARIPAHVMCAAYPGLHDLDLALAVERVAGLSGHRSVALAGEGYGIIRGVMGKERNDRGSLDERSRQFVDGKVEKIQ